MNEQILYKKIECASQLGSSSHPPSTTGRGGAGRGGVGRGGAGQGNQKAKRKRKASCLE